MAKNSDTDMSRCSLAIDSAVALLGTFTLGVFLSGSVPVFFPDVDVLPLVFPGPIVEGAEAVDPAFIGDPNDKVNWPPSDVFAFFMV